MQANGLTGFTSPTGNIGCYIDKKSVRCDISKRDWDPPARPASCNENVDYGQGIQMSAGGAPKFVCAGDTALGGGDPLPYGQSIAAGLLRCESAESGMSCRDIETGRGFSLSIQSYDLSNSAASRRRIHDSDGIRAEIMDSILGERTGLPQSGVRPSRPT